MMSIDKDLVLFMSKAMGAAPMVFISQAEAGIAKPGVEPLSPQAVVYLFGVRVPDEGGYSVVYQTIVQFRDWD